MMKLLLLTSAVCLFVVHSAAPQSHQLMDGATIKLSGIVRLVQRGNDSYLVIRPGSTYEAVFDPNDHRKVRQVGLSLAGQWNALRAVVGKKVVVSGKVQLEPSSPYYLNGTLILADSIRLDNGVVWTPKQYAPHPVPATISRFRAIVTFSPLEWNQFTYDAWDDSGRRLPSKPDYLSCRLNGPGDVMNCYCADGFAFTGMRRGKKNGFAKLEAPQPDFDFAQFIIGDEVKHSVREQVQCTRETPTK